MPFVNNDYIIVIKDFFEIKQLITKNEELKKINQLKDDFINMAGHELRTPLTAIN
jgi:signal transduction histidine kinase